jgi:SAM-dependent methyltransferase
MSSEVSNWIPRRRIRVAVVLASALDIGCGDGSLLIRLPEHAPAVTATGVDYWGTSWDSAQSSCEQRLTSRGLRASFQRMDAARRKFPDDHFDIVVSVMCFHEVHAPAGAATSDPLLALGEALRVLGPGGVFVLIDRFDDKADYGNGTDLHRIPGAADAMRREPLVELLRLPGHCDRNEHSDPSR